MSAPPSWVAYSALGVSAYAAAAATLIGLRGQRQASGRCKVNAYVIHGKADSENFELAVQNRGSNAIEIYSIQVPFDRALLHGPTLPTRLEGRAATVWHTGQVSLGYRPRDRVGVVFGDGRVAKAKIKVVMPPGLR